MTTSTHSLSPADSNSRKLLRALPYYAAYLIMGLSMSVIGPTLLALAEQTDSSLSQISIVIAGNALGVVFGSLLGGVLYDRWRGHPLFAVAAAVLGGVLVTMPLISSRWLLLVVVVVIGAGVGVMDVGGNTLIVWLFGKAVGPFMNALHLSFGVGALLAPLLADRVVVATGGIRWVYWILAGLTVPVIVWLTRIPSPDRPSIQSDQQSGEQPIRQYLLLIVMLSAFFFLHTGTELGFGNWIFSYGVAIEIGSDTAARLLNSIYWGGFTLGRVIAIPLAMKMRPKNMILIDLIGALASVTLMLVLPGWPPAVWIGTFGLGLSIASMFPTTLNLAERRMPITGKVTSYLLIGANAGAMVLPWVVGQFFESAGPQSLIVVLEVTVVLALLLFVGILRYSRKQPEGSI